MTTTPARARQLEELSRFLRACRHRIPPAEAGFTDSGRRRTPGLRREEVAAAAGVGVSSGGGRTTPG